MVKRCKFELETGFAGCKHEEIVELEFDDDLTEDEIETEINIALGDWMDDKIELWWSEIEEEKTK